MTRTAIIFGGSGYIGTRLAARLIESEVWERVLLADIKPPSGVLGRGIDFAKCDVREPIEAQIGRFAAEWIFNFAAIHREPGHAYREYFDTNLPGARNVCSHAELIGCSNILFASSIAVYGTITRPTDEATSTYPDTAYGISKLCAELIHEAWQQASSARRLVIVRPGVVYGPGDPGNILRMIRALQKGTFLMPGDGSIRKSYAYVYGLIDSMEFMLRRTEPLVSYNYVERETETLWQLVDHVQSALKVRRLRVSLPKSLLISVAHAAQLLSGGRSPIHPMRVRKAAQPTHILPTRLASMGFEFKYDFARSLRHWMQVAPEDFALGASLK